MNVCLVLTAALICLAASSHAGGITFNVHRVESTRSRLIRTGKWDVYQDLKSTIRSSRAASDSQPLIDYEDGEYIANVSIGTPPQRFLVLLSLNTGAFWVPDKTCPSSKCPAFCKDAMYCKSLCDPRCCSAKSVARLVPGELDQWEDCGWRNRFDSAKSSSYKKDGKRFKGTLTVPNAEGFIGIDTVTLGGSSGLTVPSQTFGQAARALYGAGQAYDGLLGIGPAALGLPGMTPLLYNAKHQGVIQKNVVTVALIREGSGSHDLPGGTITYGDVDTKNCDPNVKYMKATDKDLSTMSLDAFSLGGFETARPTADVWKANLGFGNTDLRGPKKVVEGLAKAAGANVDGTQLYSIACNATVPSLFVTLNGHRFEIPGAELIGPIVPELPDYCVLSMYGSDVNSVVFSVGAALARNYCMIFDYDNAQLGYSANLYRSPRSG